MTFKNYPYQQPQYQQPQYQQPQYQQPQFQNYQNNEFNQQPLDNQNIANPAYQPYEEKPKVEEKARVSKERLEQVYELLAKLEKEHTNNLINDEDYERMKKTIIDSLNSN